MQEYKPGKHSQLKSLQIRMADPALEKFGLRQRLQHAFRQMICEGMLSPGEKIPSSRQLADSLGISRDTVETLYSQLQAEDYLVRRRGCGSFISHKIRSSSVSRSFSGRASQTDGDQFVLSERGKRYLSAGIAKNYGRIKAFVADIPETRKFPVAVWEKLQKQVMRDCRSHVLLYGDSLGAESLRQAIADYINRERNARAKAEHIIILNSTQQAFSLCAYALTDPGDSIIVEEPTYQGAAKTFEAAGLELISIPVDQNGICTQALPAAKIVYTTPSCQYPTGVPLAFDRRLELIRWAKDHDAWIIEDDYDSDFHYEGQATACIQGLDKYQRTIYIGTFSKTLFPDLRIAYMVLPPSLVKPLGNFSSQLNGHTNQVSQLTLAAFINTSLFGSYVRTMRKHYAERREVLAEELPRHLSDVVLLTVPPGGGRMLCYLKEGISEKDSIRKAARADIYLHGLSQFYRLKQNKEGWLLGFAAFTPEEIKAAVQRLRPCFNLK